MYQLRPLPMTLATSTDAVRQIKGWWEVTGHRKGFGVAAERDDEPARLTSTRLTR